MAQFAGDDWSWLAGLFEGEGTAGMYPQYDKRPGRRPHDRLVVTISQKERDMLDEAKRITGVGSIHFQKSWNGWMWMAASKSAREVLSRLYPYLRSPRRQLQVSEAMATDARQRSSARHAQVAHLRSMASTRNLLTGRFNAKVS